MNSESAFGDGPSPINKLCADVEIEGTLSFSNTLEFDGNLKGNVVSTGTFIVGKGASVLGGIKTDSAVILGRMSGDIEASNRCVLKSTCQMDGDITSSLISMEDGAKYSGKFTTRRS